MRGSRRGRSRRKGRPLIFDPCCGIENDILPVVFDAFRQSDGAFRREYEGAGLGLALVRKLLLLLGGTLAIDSVPGEGTTVYESLPFKRAREGLNTLDTSIQKDGLEDVFSSYRVMVVDDDPVTRLATKRMLEKFGCAVVLAENGRQALDLLPQEKADCLLMDIQMPEMDGVTATKRIRLSPEYSDFSDICIIAMTAYAMRGDREKFITAGMDDYLSKPVDKNALMFVLQKNLVD